MKLKTAFKLSAVAVALASTSAFAATLNTSELGNDVWTDPRAPKAGNIDQAGYQYVDVGSSQTPLQNGQTTVVTNQLTAWYEDADGNDYLAVREILASGAIGEAVWYDFTALGYSAADLQAVKNGSAPLSIDNLGAPLNEAPQLSQAVIDSPVLGGLTLKKESTYESVAEIKRLDSSYLEYAEQTAKYKDSVTAEGNLTDDDINASEVLANVNTPRTPQELIESYDRGVISGIINTDKKGSLDSSDKYTKHFKNLMSDSAVSNNVYGLVASEVKTVGGSKVEVDRYTALTQAGVVVADNVTGKHTVIDANGIETDSLILNGVDVGQALGNTAILGNLSTDDINNLVNSGETLSALDTKVDLLDTKVDNLDTKFTNEVERLDGRIDAELSANAQASTAYTDKKANETLDLAKAEDAKTLAAANTHADAGDAKTLAAANTHADAGDAATLSAANLYTDAQVSNFTGRVNQLNTRIDNVEKTAYRGIAIALAAQQQIPNIGAGQVAVFGGVGHYEGETAGALGVASVFADGRTSVSAALGIAGGNEVGGRVGVAYVFGGK